MGYASSAARTCGAVRSQSEYTATGDSPISRHARMMRTAISPRLAMRIFFTGTDNSTSGNRGKSVICTQCPPSRLRARSALRQARRRAKRGGGRRTRHGPAKAGHYLRKDVSAISVISALIVVSERNIPMLLGRVPVALALQIAQGGDQLAAGLSGTNDLVHEAARRGRVRIRELLPELLDLLGARPHGIG